MKMRKPPSPGEKPPEGPALPGPLSDSLLDWKAKLSHAPDEEKLGMIWGNASINDASIAPALAELFSSLDTDPEVAAEAEREICRLGPVAIPELIRLAESSADPALETVSILFISQISLAHPESGEALDAIPMLIKKISSFTDADLHPEIRKKLMEGPGEEASTILLMLRSLNPQLWTLEAALVCLGEIAGRNRENEDLQKAVFALLGTSSSEPFLNGLIRRTIKEIGGFDPPLSKIPKGDKYEN